MKKFWPQRERIFIIPTLYGLMYGAGIIVCLMSGAIYSNSLAYLLCFFLVALFIIGMHQSHTNLKNLKLEKSEFDLLPAHARGGGQIWLKSENNEGHSNLQVQGKNGQETLNSTIERIHKKALALHRFQVHSGPRGKRKFERLKISSRFPFGLFYVWRNFDIDQDIYVYPQPKGALPLPKDSAKGEFAIDPSLDKGDDFSGHEKYQKGDSQKRIDWKAYARGRPMMVKNFDSGSNERVRLHLDQLNLPLEESLMQICKWVEDCERDQIQYKYKLGAVETSYALGPVHRGVCLRGLAEFQQPI